MKTVYQGVEVEGTVEEIKALLNNNRPLKPVISKPGLKAFNKNKPWTSEEDEYLKQNYDKVKTKKLSKILGRTYYSVLDRASSLHLSKSITILGSKKNAWTAEEDTTLMTMWNNKQPVLSIANTLNRTKKAVYVRYYIIKNRDRAPQATNYVI